MYLHPITPTEILRHIDRLPSKNSSGLHPITPTEILDILVISNRY